MDKQSTITVIIAFLLTATAFSVFAASSPKPTVNITETQALKILEESMKVNKSIIGLNSTKSIELRYTPLNWGKIIDGTSHRYLFVTRTPVEEVECYYFIESRNTWSIGWQSGEGTYIVDAQTGELLFVMENVSGGIAFISYDYYHRIEPGGWSSIEEPTVIASNAETVITLRMVASERYDASLPMSIKVTGVPQFVDVSVAPSSGMLNTGSEVVFRIGVTPQSGAPSRFEVRYDVVLAGSVRSHNSLYLAVKP